MKTCDNASVGILIERDDRFLLFERQTFPPGIAPPAGHIDSHGTPEQAAVAEVREEVGLTVTSLELLAELWLPNRCRRQPGAKGVGHQWSVFRAEVTGDLALGEREARNAAWWTAHDLGWQARRTIRSSDGLEPAWCVLLDHLGVIRLHDDSRKRALELAQVAPEEVTR